MSDHSDPRKSRKLLKPKLSTSPSAHPETSNPRIVADVENKPSGPLCPLLAKDSEWVDIIQTTVPSVRAGSSTNVSDEEEVLQLVECEEGPQLKPLAVMFPDLLDKDLKTLQGVINKTMSTTEVTRTLVDLGQKANFKFMKKTDRLIPPNKKWLESVTEYSSSRSSVMSDIFSASISSDYTDTGAGIMEGEDLKTIPNKTKLKTQGNPAAIKDLSNQNSVAHILSELLLKICGTDSNDNPRTDQKRSPIVKK